MKIFDWPMLLTWILGAMNVALLVLAMVIALAGIVGYRGIGVAAKKMAEKVANEQAEKLLDSVKKEAFKPVEQEAISASRKKMEEPE